MLFVFREDHYLLNDEPTPGTDEHLQWMQDVEAVYGRAEIIVGRNRNGPTGTVVLQFDPVIGRFNSIAKT